MLRNYYEVKKMDLGNSDVNYIAFGQFMGFVSSGVSFITTFLPDKIDIPPNKVTLHQLMRIYGKFLEDNPELLHYKAYILLIKCFVDAFPPA